MTGETLYATLLTFYPRSFRTRFGAEMMQFYRDCYPAAKPAVFWIDTLRDFAVSVPREWRREIQCGRTAIDSTLVVDVVMVSSVVCPLLLWWGWIATVVLLDLDPGAQDILLWSPAGIVLIAIATLAMACLVGILSAMAAGRVGRIDTASCSKVGDREKPAIPVFR
jgi:hypothetical protein